jgi:hypothetical protein
VILRDHVIKRSRSPRSALLSSNFSSHLMALRFSHMTVFPRPVSLADYRAVMDELEPVGVVHVGPQPMSEQVFVRLAMIAT